MYASAQFLDAGARRLRCVPMASESRTMDWGRIQANWEHFKASAQARWEEITAHELDVIGGRRELLTGHIGDV